MRWWTWRRYSAPRREARRSASRRPSWPGSGSAWRAEDSPCEPGPTSSRGSPSCAACTSRTSKRWRTISRSRCRPGCVRRRVLTTGRRAPGTGWSSCRPGGAQRGRKSTSDFLSPRACARGQLNHLRGRAAQPHPDLVEVVQEIGGILIYPVCPGALELFFSVATRQESHAERTGTACREQVPHAVPNHHRLVDRYAQPLGAREEQVGVGLGMLYLVAGHDRHAGGDAEHVEVGLGALHPPTGADRPWDARLRQVGEELARAWKGTHLRHLARVGFGMHAPDL